MGFNYGYEVWKLNKKWKEEHGQYISAGICEADIEKLYDGDWDELKDERVHRTHTQPLGGFTDSYGKEIGEDRIPLHEKFLEKLSVTHEISEWGRYAWAEDIDTPELAVRVKTLSKREVEIATYLMEDMTRTEIAEKLGVSCPRVTQLVDRIRKILRPDYQKGLKNRSLR